MYRIIPRLPRRLAALAILAMLAMFAAPLCAAELTIVGTSWPPFQMKDQAGYTGLATEIMAGALDITGVSYNIRFYPWNRCVMMYRQGEADGIYCISRQERRNEYLYYPENHLIRSRYVLFIRNEDKDRLAFDNYGDLMGRKVGVTSGYSYSPEFWKHLKKFNNYEEAVTDELNFRKLAHGRFDYFPCELANGIYLLKKTGLSRDITWIDRSVVEKDYYLAFSKKSSFPDIPNFVRRFDDALAIFKTTDRYREIRKKYTGLSITGANGNDVIDTNPRAPGSPAQ
ncbi:MAG: substrate-binding periplasmic protein [Desulfatibacillaceae bacterium]